jgi:hypothetical protein
LKTQSNSVGGGWKRPPPLVIVFKKEKNEDENKKEINICDIRRDIDADNADRRDAFDGKRNRSIARVG